MLVAAITATASAQPSYVTGKTCDSKSVQFHVHRAHVLLKSAYDLDRYPAQPKRSQIRAAQAQKRCIHVDTVRFSIHELRVKLHDKFDAYAEQRRITPFAGPSGTWWAIPYAVVYCESQGSWDARNPSGAVGPYQLLGHGAPYPAHTPETQLANHKIAHGLYESSGLGPWEASESCWG